jgi:hypothetical protein
MPTLEGLVPDRFDATKSGMKILSRIYPCNPLKGLDSDERILGNPRKSNTAEREFLQQKGDPPRKSKRTDRAAVEKEPNRLHPSASAPYARIRAK